MANGGENYRHTAYQGHQENGSRQHTQSLHERSITFMYSPVAYEGWLILHSYYSLSLLFLLWVVL